MWVLFIYPHQEPVFSLSAFKEQPCTTTTCACVCAWVAACGCCGSKWILVGGECDSPGGTWGPHLLLPSANYPKTPTPVNCIISWPKHWKQLVLFLSDSGRQLKRFRGNTITNCWFKRDHSGKATTIMGLLFISLHEAITVSILALYVIWLLSGLNYRMVFVGQIL